MSTSSGPLTSATLKHLREFWFHGQPKKLSVDEPVVKACMQRWYNGGKEVDDICRRDYLPALEESFKYSASELVERFPDSPEDALGLVILLDQIPRNVYRGTEAKKVYNEVDPKARELCRIFIKDPKNYDRKELWQTWWFRSFFYMPLMHSEELGDHQLMRDKLSAAIDTADSEAEVKAMGSTKDFEDKHRAVVEKYGRYPSRNEALGRRSTAEELEMLKDGSGW